MPYWPAENAAGHDESSNAAVFQPAGGVAGVPSSAFHVVSVDDPPAVELQRADQAARAAGVGGRDRDHVGPGDQARLDVDDL